MTNYVSTTEDKDYFEKYGGIPSEPDDILKYLQSTLKIDMKKVKEEAKKIESIPWDEIKITLFVIPRPSPRPRYSFKTSHFYVKNAQENKRFIEKVINNSNIIYTRTLMETKTFQPQPFSSMNNTEIYLAEMGLIRPMQNPDYDNLAKTYTDMIQGILLLNDNIVTFGSVDKAFSIKPRVEITIKYQLNFDSRFNKRRMMNSTSFKNTKNIVLYTELLTFTEE